MIFIYNVGIFLYKTSIYAASLFNTKARQWVEGRKDIFHKIEEAITYYPSPITHDNSSPITHYPSPITHDNSSPITHYPLPITVWMHVASLGEFEQGRPLIEALKKKTTPIQGIPIGQYKIILTFFSPSGYEIRKDYPLADHVFYLPMDSKKNAQRFLDLIQPDLVIFVKYEFWFHYLNELKNRKIQTILISGIFNKNQFFVLNLYAIILKKMLRCFTHIFVQNTPSVYALKKQGLEQVTYAGDTRIDRVMSIAAEAQSFPLIEQFVGSSPTLVCGSTWQPDEEIIIQLLQNQYFTHYKFIFAPHDISIKNIERLENMLLEPSLRYSNPSPLNPPSEGMPLAKGDFLHSGLNTISDEFKENTRDCRILIIDNIGMLSAIYRYGKVAYIGGGFGKGIHNTLEPIAFGLPVIFGKKYKKFEEANQLIATGGAFSITNYADFEEKMLFLIDKKNYLNASNAALKYIEENQGATDKIVQFIEFLSFA